MKKAELNKVVEEAKNRTKNALQIVYDSHNQGQKKQLVKNKEVKEQFDLYGVDYEH